MELERFGWRRLDQVTLTRRANADRPLDCWKEVEAFKAEVNKLEQVRSARENSLLYHKLTRRRLSNPCNRCPAENQEGRHTCMAWVRFGP